MHSCPLEESVTTLSYLTRRTLRRDHFFPPVIIQANRESIVYRAVISRPRHPLDYLMAERVMSVGIQASSTGGLQASPSTGRRSSHATEKKKQASRRSG
jgi:hypothetical protein